MTDTRDAMQALETLDELLRHYVPARGRTDREAGFAALSLLRAALEAREGEAVDVDRLHQQIMNLPCEPKYKQAELMLVYSLGHRDARHAAAELVLAASPVAAPVEARPVATLSVVPDHWPRATMLPLGMELPPGTYPLYASPVAADTQGDAQDAARYRWLRQNATREGRGYRLAEVGTDQKDQRPLKYRWYVDSKSLSEETLDAAIDAAMKEQPSSVSPLGPGEDEYLSWVKEVERGRIGGVARTELPPIDESKLPPRPTGHNGPDTDPDSPLVRYGRAKPGSGVLLERMDDGYWTPWHIANELLRSAQGLGGCVAGECGKEENRG